MIRLACTWQEYKFRLTTKQIQWTEQVTIEDLTEIFRKVRKFHKDNTLMFVVASFGYLGGTRNKRGNYLC